MSRPDRRGENFREAPYSAPDDNGADGIDWETGTLTPTELTVEESDGTPSAVPVDTIKLDAADFTLVDNADGSVSITTDEPDAAAHIVDTTDAHDASAISIVDSGGYFTATEVEGALQELGAGGGGGGMTNPMTTAGDIIVGGASGTPTRLAAGATSGHVLTSNGSGVAPSWQAGGGGGGGTGSFIGYNTAGGSFVAVTAHRVYCKKVTLAGDTQFHSIDVYVRPNTDNITGAHATILTDNSNAPGGFIAGAGLAINELYLSQSSSMPGTAGWVSIPIGAFLGAGDYWITWQMPNANVALAFDGSGSDRYFTASGFYATSAYPTAWAITTTTNTFSIRARVTT